jgi:hypothetical protein
LNWIVSNHIVKMFNNKIYKICNNLNLNI